MPLLWQECLINQEGITMGHHEKGVSCKNCDYSDININANICPLYAI